MPLEIIGHLNRYGRNVTPMAVDAVFRRGRQRFVWRSTGEVLLSDHDIESYEIDDFITWLSPWRVGSTSGRLLYHEDINDVRQGGAVPSLVYSYLTPSEESAIRTELAVAYLAQASECLAPIGDTGDQQALQLAYAKLDSVARASPGVITTKVVQSIIANELEDAVGVETELAEIMFEWSRLRTQDWYVDLNRGQDVKRGRGWEGVEVLANSLTALGAHYRTKERTRLTSEVQIDPLMIAMINCIGTWTAEESRFPPVFKLYRNLLLTAVTCDLVNLPHHDLYESEGGRDWQVFLTTLSLKNEKPFTLSVLQQHHEFCLWGGAPSAEVPASIRVQVLSGRLRGIHAKSCLTATQLEESSGRWGRYLIDGGGATSLDITPHLQISWGNTLLEILPCRELTPERRLGYEILNRNNLAQAFHKVRCFDLALEQAAKITEIADLSQLSLSWDRANNRDDGFQPRKKEIDGARNALEALAGAHNRLGFAAFGRNQIDLSEEHFLLACRALEPIGQLDNDRLVERLAFAKYMLSLLRASGDMAREASFLYDRLRVLLGGELSIWQNKCATVAKSLTRKTGSSPMETIREALRSASSELESTSQNELVRKIGLALSRSGLSHHGGTATPPRHTLSAESSVDELTGAASGIETLADLVVPLINEMENGEGKTSTVRSLLLSAAVHVLQHYTKNSTSDWFGSREYSQNMDRAQALSSSMVAHLARHGSPGVFAHNAAYEALAQYYLKTRKFDAAKAANNEYLSLNPDDRIAKMRSGILEGLLSSELSGAMAAGNEMEQRAAAMMGKDAPEAARLWFAAGEIYSSAAHRFAAAAMQKPRKEAIRCYRIVANRTHPAPVFRLAQNLYYDGQLLAALNSLQDLPWDDLRAAILFGRIVHSETGAESFRHEAATRVARALSALVLQPVVSKRSLDSLVDIACCLEKSEAENADSAWIHVLTRCALRNDIFGFSLDRLCQRRLYPVALVERAREHLGSARRDSMKILRYYLASVAHGSGEADIDLKTAASVDSEDLVAVSLASNRGEDQWFRHAFELFSAVLPSSANRQQKILIDAAQKLENSIAPKLLRIARDAVPRLVRPSTFVKFDIGSEDRYVWVDQAGLRSIGEILGIDLHAAGGGIELAEGVSVENAPVLAWTAPCVGATFNPLTLKMGSAYFETT